MQSTTSYKKFKGGKVIKKRTVESNPSMFHQYTAKTEGPEPKSHSLRKSDQASVVSSMDRKGGGVAGTSQMLYLPPIIGEST